MDIQTYHLYKYNTDIPRKIKKIGRMINNLIIIWGYITDCPKECVIYSSNDFRNDYCIHRFNKINNEKVIVFLCINSICLGYKYGMNMNEYNKQKNNINTTYRNIILQFS
jgi:hypothetical protein